LPTWEKQQLVDVEPDGPVRQQSSRDKGLKWLSFQASTFHPILAYDIYRQFEEELIF